MIPIIKPVFGKEEEKTVLEIMKSGQITRGPWTHKFKREFANYIGSTFIHTLCSGTVTLYIALKALGVKDNQGDVVIVPSMSFMATIDAAILAGAKPVVIDIDESYTMDPKYLEEAIEKYNPKAVIPVHLYGQPADMDEINKICKEKGVVVLEDAAQAHGAEYKGKKAGNLGDVSSFSFYASKNVAMGEGGALLTNDPDINDAITNWVEFGDHPALNLRITEFQAGIGYWQLKRLDETNEKRRRIARLYNEEFRELPGLIVPEEFPNRKHVYHVYALRHPERNKIIEKLIDAGIGARVYYEYTLHELRNAEHLNCEFGELVRDEIFAIPVHAALTDDDVNYIIDTMKKVVKEVA